VTKYQRYHRKNRDRRNQDSREYYAENKDRQNARRRAYYRANKRDQVAKGTKRTMARYHSDGVFRFQWNIRAGIHRVLRGKGKSARTMQLVGCSLEFLKGYLESQFQKGMTWDNYGKWEVDHVFPCTSFDLTKPEEQQRCFHYTNLQPLWRLENNKKGATVPVAHQPHLGV
jgi:hypothetical protein